MDRQIGIGIIGAGFMGMLHAGALAQLPGVRIVGASDPLLQQAPLLPGQEEPLSLYRDHQELLACKDLEGGSAGPAATALRAAAARRPG